ncbi:hypothetical protein CAPTEDRAFT_77427, partial [Capitella teleta]
NAGLTEIPGDIPLMITHIDIPFNYITTIGPNAFSKFIELTELHLYENGISIIHDQAFDALHKLKVLRLHTNKLVEIPE